VTLTVSLPGTALLDAYNALPGTPPDVEFVTWDLQTPPPRDTFDILVPPSWAESPCCATSPV